MNKSDRIGHVGVPHFGGFGALWDFCPAGRPGTQGADQTGQAARWPDDRLADRVHPSGPPRRRQSAADAAEARPPPYRNWAACMSWAAPPAVWCLPGDRQRHQKDGEVLGRPLPRLRHRHHRLARCGGSSPPRRRLGGGRAVHCSRPAGRAGWAVPGLS